MNITLSHLKNILIGGYPIDSLPVLPKELETTLFSSKAILSSFFLKINRFPYKFSIVKDRLFFAFQKEFNYQNILTYEIKFNPKPSLTVSSCAFGQVSLSTIELELDKDKSLKAVQGLMEILEAQRSHLREYPDTTEWKIIQNSSCFSGEASDQPTKPIWDQFF